MSYSQALNFLRISPKATTACILYFMKIRDKQKIKRSTGKLKRALKVAYFVCLNKKIDEEEVAYMKLCEKVALKCEQKR